MSEKPPSLAQRYADVSDTLSNVSEMVTRIDERVDIFMDKIEAVEKDLVKHIETCPAKCGLTDIVSRLSVMESKNGKALREEMLQHVQDNKQQVQENKQLVQKVNEKVETLDKLMIAINASTEQQAGRWKWMGLFLFNALFNIVALVGAAWLLHVWKLTTP